LTGKRTRDRLIFGGGIGGFFDWGEHKHKVRRNRGTGDAPRLSISLNRCLAIKTKLPKLALQILRYLREHPEAQDTVEGIMVWWVSERAIKNWLPQVRRSLAALVARGYLEKRKTADGRLFYRVSPSQPGRREGSRK
jgi:hypothetical protein